MPLPLGFAGAGGGAGGTAAFVPSPTTPFGGQAARPVSTPASQALLRGHCGTSPAASPALGVALKPEREEPVVVSTACPRFATEALCDVGSGGLEHEGKALPVQERFLLSPV